VVDAEKAKDARPSKNGAGHGEPPAAAPQSGAA
jgi:hypothetical protein